MTYQESSGVYGAKRATWDENQTRPVFERLRRDNPAATRTELAALYCDEIAADPDLLRHDLHYCFNNHWLASERDVQPGPRRRPEADDDSPATQEQRAQAVASKAKAVAAATKRLKGMLLMALVMPNGKQLGDCSGRDLGKFGGWLTTLRKKIGDRQLVRAVFSEDELKAAWAKR